MHFLKVFISVVLALIVFESTAQAIRCYTCKNVDSNSKCTRLERCARSSDGCQNTVRIENGLILISKGCQQTSSCRSNSIQNSRQCFTLAQSLKTKEIKEASRNLPPSVCRSCCTRDRCNGRLYLQTAGRNSKYYNSKTWRSLRPSIRNVKISVLNSDTALITFVDRKKHTADFFNFRTRPYSKSIKFTPVFFSSDSIPGVHHDLPRNGLAYIASGLNAGKRYRLTIINRNRKSFFQHRVFQPFVTKPRPPRQIAVDDTTINSVTVHVQHPQQSRGDRFSSLSISYRKASDPPSAARRLNNYNRPELKKIENLEPATEYVISAWTNVVDSRGRLLASSQKINTTVFTDIPGITNLETREVHATNITWTFRVPQYASSRSQQEFVVHVRDDTNSLRVVDTIISSSRRSFTAAGLTPQTAYSIRINARTNGRDSTAKSTKPVFTLIRCYACNDALSDGPCNHYVECPADSGGCLNEVRRRSGSYRATLRCKQVKACNNSELQDRTTQCNPDRNRNVDPPNVCRCCCEGDLCNGPTGDCGHILGWLTPFRSPPRAPTITPPFCADPEIAFGEVSCSNEREIGSVCSYKCTGKTFLDGAASITCFDDGKWNPEIPRCLPANTCPELPDSEGTFYNCTRGFVSGSRCSVKCMEGYLIVGDPVLSCLSSGSWNQKFFPTCLSENNCQPDPCYNGATCHDGVNDYECDCVPGWTGKDCDQEVRCEQLTRPDNGQLQCTDNNRYLSRCRYSCNYGYEQHGSTYTRCLADGYWSSFEPTLCVIKTCPVPPIKLVNNGRADCTGFGLGDTCHFTCPSGLKVSGGPENITCRSDETWSGSFPCCDLECPPHAKVDLYFLLDSSSSVGSANWALLVNFTVGLLDEFVVGPTDMVVGVGRYNRRFDTKSEISFGDYKSFDDLKAKIEAIPYDGRGTRTGRALRHVYDVSLTAPGNRPDVPDILVVITDGRSQDRPNLFATLIKRNRKATIYAVGIRSQHNKLNVAELLSIASSPSNLHIMDDGYEQLVREFKSTLAREVCWIPCQHQYEQREVELRQRQLAAMTGDEFDAAFWSEYDSKNQTTTTATKAPNGRTQKPPGSGGKNERQPIPIEPEINSQSFVPVEPESDENNSRPFIEEEN